MHKELGIYLQNYLNTEEHNNFIHSDFTTKTDSIQYLKLHRDYIENNSLGFGDRAFTYMWFLILRYVQDKELVKNVLEIGVYKGQIISLWTLISQKLDFDLNISAITPLKGNPKPKSNLMGVILTYLSKKYRRDVSSGNHYSNLDYLQIITSLYSHFDLSMNKVNILKGYSTDKNIIRTAGKLQYSVIYIDGDHTFNGVSKDIYNYHGLLQKGGLLIMDDASCNIPGSNFWKGHQSVSDACRIIEKLGFTNIFNVGHNRIYQKI